MLLLKQPENKETLEAFAAAEKAKSEWLQKCERKPIGLKYDGESFTCETLEKFKDTLLMLRAEGYIFPDYVLDDIDYEMNERNNLE